MHYADLVRHTSSLGIGPHIVYDLPEGKIEIRNLGVRHRDLSSRDEFRLYLHVNGREITPRHGDFFTDFMLKTEARPDLHLPLMEACEQLCNGLDPQGLITSKRFPKTFSESGEATWSLQTSSQQTAGLPTALFLHGLQALIRVYELNGWLDNPQEAFRGVFLKMEKGESPVETLRPLQPLVRAGKRYFDRLERS